MIYSRRGNLVRIVYLSASFICWVLTGFGRLFRNRVIVLCYHGVKNHQADQFAWQMSKITRRTIATTRISQPDSETYKKPQICLTFDDAFANLLQNALPVMQNYHLPATIYLAADNMDDFPRWDMPENHPERTEKIMSFQQIKDLMKNDLFTIASHTLSHEDLTILEPDEMNRQMTESKQIIKEQTGIDPTELALPYGRYNETVLQAAWAAGYQTVFTLQPICNKRTATQKRLTGRFLMSPDVWKCEFLLTCAGGYAWLYPLRKMIACLKGRKD